jgi:putative addiction module antidote
MTTLTITAIGNSVGVVLPKEIISDMQVSRGDKLFLTKTPDGSYRITPYDPEFEEKMMIARKIMRRRRNALRELGK